MVNKVILIGRLGKDPELKTTGNGTSVCNFTIATDESYKDKSGQKVDKTEWHNIIAWGKLAEICGEYLSKGKLIYIEGSLTTSSWEDKTDGKKRFKTEVNASQMKMLDRSGSKDTSVGDDDDFRDVKKSKVTTPQDDDEEVPF